MGFGNPYKFYLMQGTDYLFVDPITGGVANQPDPIELNYAPKNWENISISWERGWTYNALMRMYSSEFQFVKDGATILRWGYYLSGGIEKNIKLVIKKLNPTIAGNMAYEDFVECEVDYTTMKDGFSEVEINLIEGGFISKMKARENTTYEIDVVNNADRIWIRHDGIKLDCILRWGILNESLPTAFTDDVLPTSFYIDKEGTNISLTPISVEGPPTFQSKFLLNVSASPVELKLKLKLNIDAIMPGTNTDNGVLKVRYEMTQYNPQAFVSHTVVYMQGGLTPGSTTTINLDQIDTITLPANHALEFNIIVDDGAGGGGTNDYQIDILDGCEIKASYSNIKPETYIAGLRTKKVFDHLVEQIGDATTTAVSTLLETTHPDKIFLCGDSVRGLENSTMKLSFTELWKSLNVYCPALNYNKVSDILSIEAFETAFDDMTFVADLGDVNNFKSSPLTSQLFSKLKAGFGSYVYDEINGKDEFNQLTEFLTPITRATAEKDITSLARADMYGIEYARINLTGKETTDADTDNDIFWIHIETGSAGTVPDGLPGAGEPYYNIYRKPIDLVAGPDYWEVENLNHADTAYNLFFSAKRHLQRWAQYLSSMLYLLDNELIKFQVTAKNNPDGTKLKTSEGDPVAVIDEAANQFVADYLPAKFKPVVFEFDFADKSVLTTAIAGAPNGYFTFNHKGLQLEGFILKINSKPKLETQSCMMLATANCDLLNLVY
jgi:hypothetical protein